MKKIYIALFMLAISAASIAQTSRSLVSKSKMPINKVVSHNDFRAGGGFLEGRTILGLDTTNGTVEQPVFPIFDMNEILGTSYMFQVTEGVDDGFWFGTNCYQYDSLKNYPLDYWCQSYLNDNDITIVGAVALFNNVIWISNDTVSDVGVNLYTLSLEGASYTDQAGATKYTYGPDTIITAKYVKVRDLRGRNEDGSYIFNTYFYDAPVNIGAGAGFCLVSDFSYARMKGDSCNLASSRPTTGGMQHMASTLFSYYDPKQQAMDGFIVAIDDNVSEGGLFDCNLALFAIIDKADAICDKNSTFYQGMKLSINPNVVKEVANVSYAIENNANVSMDIIDATGRVVKTINQGAKAKGQYSVTIDVNGLKAGNYLFSLNSNGQRLIKKMIIE